MVEFAGERGYEDLTVRGLARLAGISTGTFYRHFPNAQHCFSGAYEWLMRSSLRRARAAQRRSEDWETGIRAALQSVLDDLSRHPKAARLVLIEAYAAGPALHSRMRREVAGFERLLVGDPRPESAAITEPLCRGIAAGVLRVARTRLLSGQIARLSDDGCQLGDWIVSLFHAPTIGWESLEGPEIPVPGAGSHRQPPEDLRRAIGGPPGSENGRVFAAVAKLSAIHGFEQLTIPRIRAEAGVPRRYLDDRFADAEGCFLAAIEAIATHAAASVAQAGRQADSWPAAVDAVVLRLCEEVAGNPTLAHLLFVEILAPGRRGLLCREELVSLAATHLRAAPPEQRPSQLVAEASSAALWRIVRADVAARRTGAVPRLAPLLIHVILAPTIEQQPAGVERHWPPNLDYR